MVAGNHPTPREFVSTFSKSHAPAVYTVIPTIIQPRKRSFNLLALPFHLARLQSSLSHLSVQSSSASIPTNHFPRLLTAANVLNSIKASFSATFEGETVSNSKLSLFDNVSSMHGIVTVVAGYTGSDYIHDEYLDHNFQIHSLISPKIGYDFESKMSDLPTIYADLQFFVRSNPAAKDCFWTIERLSMEENRRKKQAESLYTLSETIIARYDNNNEFILTEGLTSSLHLLSCDSSTPTLTICPSDLALEGSMGQCIAIACKQLGIDVIKSAIPLHEIYNHINIKRKTKALFLSSATKPLQRVEIVASSGLNIPFHSDSSMTDMNHLHTILQKHTANDVEDSAKLRNLEENLRKSLSMVLADSFGSTFTWSTK